METREPIVGKEEKEVWPDGRIIVGVDDEDAAARHAAGRSWARSASRATSPTASGSKRRCRWRKEAAERRKPREERVPGQHEPRDPHADERHHRHDRAGARHRADARAARVPRRWSRSRASRCCADQRHPRFLEDRGGQARAGRGRISRCATGWATRCETLALCGRSRRGWSWRAAIDPDVPDRLVGDPGRLRQIVVNLVGNAIKFTEQGEVVVEVSATAATNGEAGSHCRSCDQPNGALLHFAVRDTGIGIPPEKQAASSRRSSRPTARPRGKYGGTGLGLAISPQLVELMGGRIWVESEPGRGSTFHFTARFGLQRDAAVRAVGDRAAAAGRPARCWSSTTTPPTAGSWWRCCGTGGCGRWRSTDGRAAP